LTNEIPEAVPSGPLSRVVVTKIEAAQRQLDEAIALFFEMRDVLSIHTLACAASQITADLLTKVGSSSIIRSGALIKSERRKEVLAIFAKPENFLKHANRDPDDTLSFNPDITPFFVFSTALELTQLGRPSWPGHVFQRWFLLRYPHLIQDPGPLSEFIRVSRIQNVTTEDRDLFLEMVRNGPPPEWPAVT